jgi:nucleoside-diphosphate-sugar epimerase
MGHLMKVFIAGIDGYLGWPLAQYLAVRGHDIGGADNFFRRRWVEEMGSCSALPIAPMTERIEAFLHGDVLEHQATAYAPPRSNCLVRRNDP